MRSCLFLILVLLVAILAVRCDGTQDTVKMNEGAHVIQVMENNTNPRSLASTQETSSLDNEFGIDELDEERAFSFELSKAKAAFPKIFSRNGKHIANVLEKGTAAQKAKAFSSVKSFAEQKPRVVNVLKQVPESQRTANSIRSFITKNPSAMRGLSKEEKRSLWILLAVFTFIGVPTIVAAVTGAVA